jgi:hypothetical protein
LTVKTVFASGAAHGITRLVQNKSTLISSVAGTGGGNAISRGTPPVFVMITAIGMLFVPTVATAGKSGVTPTAGPGCPFDDTAVIDKIINATITTQRTSHTRWKIFFIVISPSKEFISKYNLIEKTADFF